MQKFSNNAQTTINALLAIDGTSITVVDSDSYEISGSATIESYQELLQDGRTVWHMNKSGSLGNGSASYNYTSHATVFDTGTYIYSIDESYSDTGNSGYGRSDSIAYIDVARDIEFRFKNFKEVNSSSVDENGNVLKDINNNPISYEIPQIALQTTEDITRLETSVVIKNKL